MGGSDHGRLHGPVHPAASRSLMGAPITAPVTLASRDLTPTRLGLPAKLPTTVDGALDLATHLGRAAFGAKRPTRHRWEVLATLAAHDLGVARAVEPHLDALQILAQAGEDLPDGVWGVFAAEGGDDPLIATQSEGRWTLTGTKPWCSLAGSLDGALITATTSEGSRQLFAVGLTSAGVEVLENRWHARGLSEIPSGPIRLTSVAAAAVGDAGWYLDRPGFAWGGIGVAACWYGGAVGIGRSVHAAAAAHANPFLLAHLGAIDEGLQSARRALDEAAAAIDDESAGDPRLLAKRVRATVARICDDVIDRSGRAMGPAPLALDERHAKRVADLQLYVRQHHAERDLESLGSAIASDVAPW